MTALALILGLLIGVTIGTLLGLWLAFHIKRAPLCDENERPVDDVRDVHFEGVLL